MSKGPRDHRSEAKQKRKEDRYILEDLCFCDLTNDICREGAGKTKQDLEMSPEWLLDNRRQWNQGIRRI